MKDKKLWIFDFDGVLVFSVRITFACIIESAKELGIKEPNFFLLKKLWSTNFEDLFDKLAKNLNWTYSQKNYVLAHFLKKNQNLVYPRPNRIYDFIKKASQNKDLAILTNRNLENLIACAYKFSINLNSFKLLVCAENGLYKPNPEIFKNFWQANYKPAEVVFIGDSIVFDLMTVQNHSPPLDFIAISSGLHEKNEFIKAGLCKEFIFKSPVEMEKWL
jgi:HAD superfamily hydrolase (TIGR01549 family)